MIRFDDVLYYAYVNIGLHEDTSRKNQDKEEAETN